jgi:hypothetical protein
MYFRFVRLRLRVGSLLQVSANFTLEGGEDAERVSITLLQPVLQVRSKHGSSVMLTLAAGNFITRKLVLLLKEIYPGI